MNVSLRPPGGERTWNAVLLFLGGSALLALALGGYTTSPKVFLAFGGLFVVSAIGLWFRRGWARWTGGVGLLIYAALIILAMALRTGFRVNGAGVALVTLWISWQLLSDSDRKTGPLKKRGDDSVRVPPQPLTSLVLLLSGPRQLASADVAIAVTKAWGGTYGFQDEVGGGSDKENWVVGRSPVFLIKSPEAMFMFHNNPAPYSPESKALAQSIPDLRLRKAVEDHCAWVAVDLMQPFDESRPRDSFYPAIGRLIAEVAGGDCLAVFHPQSKRINAWDESLREILRGPDPLKNFGVPVNPPMLQVDDQDPDLAAGVAEARRRFPEFLEAWQRKDGQQFSVKAPVTAGGRTEHIWIEVDEVRDDRIGGKLGNEPVDLGGMKIGDRVDVAHAEVEDWVVVRGGSPVGLFTARAVGKNLKKS
jgi:uncharacterized protein YegJ (DUF2314 family)